MITHPIAAFPGRTCRVVLLAGFAGATLIGASRADAFEITYAQRLACTPDAFRLCSEHIPDATAVRACMLAKKEQLSDGCRAMFRNASATH